MAILRQGSTEKFREYSQFKSKKDFNNQFEMWMCEYKHLFTASEYLVLNRLRKFCVNEKIGTVGVANAMIRTILEAIKEKDCPAGASRSTFKRMLRKAKRIGMIEALETERKDGSQSSNIYVFQRYDSREVISTKNTIEPPRTKDEQEETAPQQEEVVEQLDHLKTSNTLIKTNNIKSTTEIDHTYLPNFINESFIETARPFFTAEEIYKLWLRVLIAYQKSNVSRPIPEVIGCVNKALKQTVFMYKLGKIKKSFEGYFYRLTENYLGVERRKEVQVERPSLFYDWLNN